VKVTICPPGEALGARDLQRWSSRRIAGRSGVRSSRSSKGEVNGRVRPHYHRDSSWIGIGSLGAGLAPLGVLRATPFDNGLRLAPGISAGRISGEHSIGHSDSLRMMREWCGPRLHPRAESLWRERKGFKNAAPLRAFLYRGKTLASARRPLISMRSNGGN
jgi:hypothetical protein